MPDSLLLSGTSELSLDPKGRIAVPARYRDLISANSDKQIVFTRSLFDKCLWLYPVTFWDEVVKSLGQLPTMTDPVFRSIQRILLGSAVYCQMDSQGRILIPFELRNYAMLEKKAFLLGLNNKFELWSDQQFTDTQNEDLRSLESAYQNLGEHELLNNLKI